MKALDRKAFRDLWHLRSQALAIALVIAAGIANLIMAQSTLESLYLTRDRFYRDYAFADVWAGLKRAPEALAKRIGELDGVMLADTRIVVPANLSLEGFTDPVKGMVISLPDDGEPRLNRLYLRAGRFPAPNAQREVVASEAFAEAHGLRPGAEIRATIYGRSQRFRLVGIVLSPEYVYQIQPGAAFPDFKRFGVFWMGRRALEAAADMDGAFNSVVLRLLPGTQPTHVIAPLDALLRRYGGQGAYARADQLSHRFLDGEFEQLRTIARLFPTIFLGVAAFLLNVVVARTVGMQRDQIAILKAFGYGNRAVALHYALIILMIVVVGTLIGLVGGIALGQWMSGVYREFYRFPFLDFRLGPGVVATGAGVSVLAAIVGTFHAVRAAARLPPAEAMRPPAPERYRPALLERMGLGRHLSQPTRMIARHLERRPFKSLLTVLGLALACAIMMIGRFQNDAIDFMVDVQFRIGQRNDISVDFSEPAARQGAFELRALPGVQAVEPYRTAAVRLRNGLHSYRTGLQGLLPDGAMKRPVDIGLSRVALPPEGVLMTDFLAGMLGLRVGDEVEIEVLEGRQRKLRAPVVALVREYIGVQAYMSLDAMNRLLGDGDVISGAYLKVDANEQTALYRLLEERPRVAGIGARLLAVENFYDTLAESILVFTFVALVLGAVINFGVVYNSARISLSERGRELASLRVLGFTRGEVGYILLGELALLVAIAIPLGFVVGKALCAYFALSLQSDLYRIPVYVSTSTYAFAGITMVVSTVLSALIVRRRISRLDLIEVLKTRE
jgi:putative ABC transport system permease protein